MQIGRDDWCYPSFPLSQWTQDLMCLLLALILLFGICNSIHPKYQRSHYINCLRIPLLPDLIIWIITTTKIVTCKLFTVWLISRLLMLISIFIIIIIISSSSTNLIILRFSNNSNNKSCNSCIIMIKCLVSSRLKIISKWPNHLSLCSSNNSLWCLNSSQCNSYSSLLSWLIILTI